MTSRGVLLRASTLTIRRIMAKKASPREMGQDPLWRNNRACGDVQTRGLVSCGALAAWILKGSRWDFSIELAR